MTEQHVFKSALKLFDVLSLDSFRNFACLVIPDPTFTEYGMLNIRPQFSPSHIGALTFENFYDPVERRTRLEIVDCSSETCLEKFRFEAVVFWSFDLSIITVWQQSEIAIVLLRKENIKNFEPWIDDVTRLLSELDTSTCSWLDGILIEASQVETFMCSDVNSQ